MGISVVTAVYNGEEFLRAAVDSILKQTVQDFEYIIVNDGSTDCTKELLEQIYDPRLKVIHQAKNLGAARSLNHAVRQAKGDWIAVQDADDLSLPKRLEKQAAYLEKRPDVGLAGSYVRCIFEEPWFAKRASAAERLLNSETADPFYGSNFCHGTFMFSKKLFYELGGYSEQYQIAYDYDLLMRFRKAAQVSKIPEVLYEYRLVPGSLSNQDVYATNQESIEVSLKGIADFTKKDPRDYLIVGSDYACQFFQKRFEPLLQPKKCHYWRTANYRDFIIIVLDHPGSQKIIRQLKGCTYFKIWCVFNGEDSL